MGLLSGGIADMKPIHHSILAWSLMTGAASLAFMMMGAAGVRADIVIVQGDNGSAGDPGLPGGDGESVAADAGSVHPVTVPPEQGHRDRRKWRPRRQCERFKWRQRRQRRSGNRDGGDGRRSGSATADADSFGGAGGAGGIGGNGASARAPKAARAATRPRRATRRTETVAPSPAARPRKAATGATEAALSSVPKEARAVARRLTARRHPAARGTSHRPRRQTVAMGAPTSMTVARADQERLWRQAAPEVATSPFRLRRQAAVGGDSPSSGGGSGGGASASSTAMSGGSGIVDSTANAIGGMGGGIIDAGGAASATQHGDFKRLRRGVIILRRERRKWPWCHQCWRRGDGHQPCDI